MYKILLWNVEQIRLWQNNGYTDFKLYGISKAHKNFKFKRFNTMAYRHNKNNNKDYEKDGVFYTPSKNAENFSEQDSFDSFENYGKNKKVKKIKKKTPAKIPPQKSQYPIFMILAVGIGAVVFVALFIIMFNVINPDKGSDKKSNIVSETTTVDYESSSNPSETVNSFPEKEYLGVIRSKSDAFKTLIIYNINSNDNSEYTVTGGTLIHDKYNKGIVFDELSEGDLINFVYDKNNALVSITKSDKEFKETLKNGYKIDTINKMITTNTKTYSYTDMTNFIYKTENFSPDFLDPSIDLITISGYDDTIWTVKLDKGHGELEVKKNDKIKNGIIEIDTNIYRKLPNITTVKLNEGTHKVVVKGDNIEAFIEDIEIAVNEKSTLDLNTIPIKAGKVTIRPNVSDYALYINGNLELSREPLELEYGQYTIEIVKDGYINYSSRFTVNTPEKLLKPVLAQEVKMGTLTVNSNPTGANLLIDGMASGQTPYTGDLVEGQHSITLKKEGYKDITIGSVYISGQGASYNVELQKE